MSASIAVAVAVLLRDDRQILLCQRSPRKSYPLQWEFPGGKLESGETPMQALKRELFEELAITAEDGTLLHQQTSVYPGGEIFSVHYYLIEEWSGAMVNMDFADIRWIAPSDLPSYDILVGNREFCSLLATGGFPALV